MITVRVCKGDIACQREPGPDGFCNQHRPPTKMPAKSVIRFSEFTPIAVPYESGGAALPDKPSAEGLCKRINDLAGSLRWRVEELKLNGKSYWLIVSDT